MSADKKNKSYSSFQPSDSAPSSEGASRGSFRREPPVVPERVAVLKANYKQAWLYFLLIVCLVVAWGIPLRYALVRFLAFRPADPGERTAMAFVSIAYEGISDMPTEVTPERFEQQMKLLKERGYHAITLEEVRALYQSGEPLPENAILLTFDHSRKSSYFDARRILQKLGWYAVMFVWTKPIEDEDPSALRWPYIRAMIGTGAWEAGAQSHLGFERIVADSEGRLKNYLTSPRWLAGSSRYETPEEYQERLREDHELVYNRIVRETKTPPIAFAFPYGDFGQYDERALLTRRLNMALVDEYYDLAFIHGTAALNTMYSDPLRLNRLLVDPDWSAEDLLDRLEAAWPRERGVNNESAMKDPLSWQVDWGGFQLKEDTATFHALEDNTGSKVWLNGTDLYRDFSGSFRLRITSGQVGIFLRASKDGESYLYLGLGDKGEVWLRQKHEGMEPFTLGTSRYRQEPDGTVALEVYLRDNQFYASTGGQPVFDEIILTRGESSPGIVGLSVWDPAVGVAEFELFELNLNPFYNRIVTWKPLASRQPELAGWLEKNGYRHTHLSPPWLHLGDRGRSEQPGWSPDYYRELAKVYNMKFAPEVIVERIEAVDPAMGQNLAVRAKESGASVVYCNLSLLRGAGNLSRITAWIQTMSKALERQGVEMIVSLPEGLATGTSINSLLQGLSNLKVASTEENLLSLEDLSAANQRLVSWNAVTLGTREYPLHFQLTGMNAREEVWTTVLHSQVLYEEGITAYNTGDFDSAIKLWTRWSELEPYNEKPLRLVGDVHLRRQEYRPAVQYYRESLELNPGQVDLVLNTAAILEKFMGNRDEASQLLKLYQRLFPGNSEIALAHAGLLLREGNQEVAGRRIQDVVEQNPDDLTALALLQPLLQSTEERMANMRKILQIGRRLGMHDHFANTVDGFDLLIWPESWVLMDLVAERADEESGSGKTQYRKLLPRDTVVRENFRIGAASDNWDNPTGPLREQEEGSLFLGATPTSTEATLILKGSETLRNGFVEAQLEQARGFFWLYARRSDGNMIRFGFESSGELYLQIWTDNEIVSNQNRKWDRPHEKVTLRLEIRGDAVFTYIDGRPAFGAPMEIPANMKLGWWGMAPWAPQFGVAEVLVREVAGGPLPMNIGLYRAFMEEGVDDLLVDKLKPNTHQLSVFSPNWFFQDVKGDIRKEFDFDLPGLRLLTRYYKIRLYPLIRSSSSLTLDVGQLRDLAKANKVDGFTLEFTKMPDDEWFAKAEQKLLGTKLGLLAVRLDPLNQVVEVREIGSASSLLEGPRSVKDFPMVAFNGIERPQIPILESLDPVENPPVETEAAGAKEKDSGMETVPEAEGTSETEDANQAEGSDTTVKDEENQEMLIPAPAETPAFPEAPATTRPRVPSQVFMF